VRALYDVFADPNFRKYAEAALHGLETAPFVPSVEDYERMLPLGVRVAIDTFINTLKAGTPEQAADATRLQPIAPPKAAPPKRRAPAANAPYTYARFLHCLPLSDCN
jgi:hypothetical protein